MTKNKVAQLSNFETPKKQIAFNMDLRALFAHFFYESRIRKQTTHANNQLAQKIAKKHDELIAIEAQKGSLNNEQVMQAVSTLMQNFKPGIVKTNEEVQALRNKITDNNHALSTHIKTMRKKASIDKLIEPAGITAPFKSIQFLKKIEAEFKDIFSFEHFVAEIATMQQIAIEKQKSAFLKLKTNLAYLRGVDSLAQDYQKLDNAKIETVKQGNQARTRIRVMLPIVQEYNDARFDLQNLLSKADFSCLFDINNEFFVKDLLEFLDQVKACNDLCLISAINATFTDKVLLELNTGNTKYSKEQAAAIAGLLVHYPFYIRLEQRNKMLNLAASYISARNSEHTLHTLFAQVASIIVENNSEIPYILSLINSLKLNCTSDMRAKFAMQLEEALNVSPRTIDPAIRAALYDSGLFYRDIAHLEKQCRALAKALNKYDKFKFTVFLTPELLNYLWQDHTYASQIRQLSIIDFADPSKRDVKEFNNLWAMIKELLKLKTDIILSEKFYHDSERARKYRSNGTKISNIAHLIIMVAEDNASYWSKPTPVRFKISCKSDQIACEFFISITCTRDMLNTPIGYTIFDPEAKYGLHTFSDSKQLIKYLTAKCQVTPNNADSIEINVTPYIDYKQKQENLPRRAKTPDPLVSLPRVGSPFIFRTASANNLNSKHFFMPIRSDDGSNLSTDPESRSITPTSNESQSRTPTPTIS